MDKPPEKSVKREVAQALVESGLSLIPFAGGSIAVAFNAAMALPYNRRMARWLEDIAAAVTELQDRPGFEDLANNDDFLDAFAAATLSAQTTHLEEKLTALRNGVLNTLGPNAPDADKQARFLRLVDEFTPAHMHLLAFLNDPRAVFDNSGRDRPDVAMGGTRGDLLGEAAPEFAGQDEWYQLLYRDLIAAGLTSSPVGGLGGVVTGPALWASVTSDLGQQFIAFVSDPPR